MSDKKYAEENDIRNKIQQLFSYRKLNDLLHISQLEKNKTFTDHLTDIQYQIYILDTYLESHWVLDADKRKSCWDNIKASLSRLQISSGQHSKLLREIRQYERIEMACRKDAWPTRVSFRKFYTVKSCDVRLIRDLIYTAHPALKGYWKKKAWVYYDRITEINDDISDIQEDLVAYNGNRFLISVLRKGIKKTGVEYRRNLVKIIGQAEVYFQKRMAEGSNKQLYDWTMDRATETLELLEHTLKQTEPEMYSGSVWLHHMK